MPSWINVAGSDQRSRNRSLTLALAARLQPLTACRL